MSDAPAISRRRFLSGSTRGRPFRALPPRAAVPDACTACGLCVTACPSRIVSLRDGLHLDFTSGECTFCGACADVCPEPVFDRAQPEPFPHVVAIAADCLARRGVVCQACRDACPEAAIRFIPRRGGPFLPDVIESACTGCGACVAPCPVAAISPALRAERHDA